MAQQLQAGAMGYQMHPYQVDQHQQPPSSSHQPPSFQTPTYHSQIPPHPHQHQPPEPQLHGSHPQLAQHATQSQQSNTALMHSSRGDDPSVSQAPAIAGEQQGLNSISKVDEYTKRRYTLQVAQQPKRARMCGFGDKDRRPITPPPCVRLIVTDAHTGQEIDCNDVDHAMFMLIVDLWNDQGTREVNLVRSSTTGPPLSTAASISYAPPDSSDGANTPYTHQATPASREQSYGPPSSEPYQSHNPPYGFSPASPNFPGGSSNQPLQYYSNYEGFSDQGAAAMHGHVQIAPNCGRRPGAPAGVYSQDPHSNALARVSIGTGQPQGMFTRNLIGSVAASAFRLKHTNDAHGIWFVLQDLSVRTEGPFRLRFSFVDITPRGPATQDAEHGPVHRGRAPILASCFSEPFQVFSAKKFPGVCESTELSKRFAGQGIKIPIRKDNSARGGDDDDDD